MKKLIIFWIIMYIVAFIGVYCIEPEDFYTILFYSWSFINLIMALLFSKPNT